MKPILIFALPCIFAAANHGMLFTMKYNGIPTMRMIDVFKVWGVALIYMMLVLAAQITFNWYEIN